MALESRNTNSFRLGALPLLIVLGSAFVFCAATAAEYGQLDNAVAGGFFAVLAGVLPLVCFIAFALRRRWMPGLQRRLEAHTDAIDAMPPARLWLWTALAAGVGLYLELVLIRFHSSAFQVFAYFKNVSLLSCFLGLGIGYALGGVRPLMTPLALPLLTIQLVFLHLMRFTVIGNELHNPISEEWALGLQSPQGVTHIALVFSVVVWVFSFNALCMIPLGQLASRIMGRMGKLPAYGWNLLGSLAGICGFYAVSFLWAPPVAWFAIGIIGLAVFLRGSLMSTIVTAGIMLAVLSMSLDVDTYDIYSPYQILTVRPLSGGYPYPQLLVNHSYFQRILNLSPEMPRVGVTKLAEDYYSLPYKLNPLPQDVLIVGSGTGNDVAAALRNGAGHIDAVEIDPAILRLGQLLHPEKPYQSDRVTPHVQDARAFIRYSHNRYDLIVYGLLDSHTLLSGMGGVRLDSYVYTVEAFREVKSLLKDNGIICLSFVTHGALNNKIYQMLKDAFDGQPPIACVSVYDQAVTFVAGKDLSRIAQRFPPEVQDATAMVSVGGHGDPSTDDWPFFYMPNRTYPVSYLVMIAILLVTAAAFIRPVFQRGGGGGFSGPCFLLGAGFMLLETKAITELALFYGSTWVVIGIVIAAILIMAFFANLLIMGIPGIPRLLSYALLLASLGLSLWFPTVSGNIQSEWTSRLLATGIITLPLFFSGLVFSSEMNSARSVAAALGSNLIGAMLGGCLEYNSMYFGYRSLYVLALAIYGLSAIVSLFRPRSKTGLEANSSANLQTSELGG